MSSVLAREPKNPEALGAKRPPAAGAEPRAGSAGRHFSRRRPAPIPSRSSSWRAAYLSANRIADARNAATEALRRNPGHPWAIAVLGHALILDGQRAQGVEYLQRAVAIRPRRPVVWEALAAGFEAAGQAADAARCRQEAKALTNAADCRNWPPRHRGYRAENRADHA